MLRTHYARRGCRLALGVLLAIPAASSCGTQDPATPQPECLPGDTAAECPAPLPSMEPVQIPAQGDWVDRGAAFSASVSGWDVRLEGAISPVSAIKKDGGYVLYYIGADGDRGDGGPANRALGAALSSDGIQFERWSGNPVLRYQPSAPGGQNVVEEGVFSGGATVRRSDGMVVLLFGGMDAVGPTDVSGSGVLATSVDGLTFDLAGPVLRPEDPGTIGTDEIFPMAVVDTGSEWVAYYIATGSIGHDWSWAVASGNRMDRLGNDALVLDSSERSYPGGSDAVWLSNDQFLVPVLSGFGGAEGVVEFRVVDVDRPSDLSNVAETVVFENLAHFTILLDREEGLWFMYYLDAPGESIRVKTAAMRLAN